MHAVLRLPPSVDDASLRKEFQGRPPQRTDFDTVLRSNVDCVDAQTGRLILAFRKSVIEPEFSALARQSYGDIDERERPSVTRRAAAGKLDVERFRAFRSDVVELIQITPTTGFLKLADGRVLKQPMSNPVHSYLAGYGVERFENTARKNLLTRRYPERWRNALPFFAKVGAVLQRELPEVYALHLKQLALHPKWRIPSTALSSVTINVNYESHYHYDVGDFRKGYSTLTVVEIGSYSGGFLVFPKYRLAVDVRQGDVLLCQSHVDMHGNFRLEPQSPDAKRVSFVTYLKEKLGQTVNRLDGPDEQDDWADGKRLKAGSSSARA